MTVQYRTRLTDLLNPSKKQHIPFGCAVFCFLKKKKHTPIDKIYKKYTIYGIKQTKFIKILKNDFGCDILIST